MDQSQDELKSIKDEIARKVGVCVIRLQQYEVGLKRLVAVQEVSGTPTTLPINRAKRTKHFSNKTLGQVTSALLEGLLGPPQDDREVDSERGEFKEAFIRVTLRVPMTEQELQQAEERLSEFVERRNELVHHFTERFDLKGLKGCNEALSWLAQLHADIERQHQQLRGWADTIDQSSRQFAELLNAPGFDDLLYFGIIDGQPMNWPETTIVQQLKNVELAFAENGWTCLAKTIREFQSNWPELTPRKYRCSSWRHLLHESGLFEIQKRDPAGSGPTQIWFRSKAAKA